MDQNGTGQAPMQQPEHLTPVPETGPASEATESARKPYARPQLTERGRLPSLTLGKSGTQVTSDRHVKEAFEELDPRTVLAAVARLPIERWSYKGETARHLGPMAQDFAAAFSLGEDDRHIFTLDAAGVALAAIQGLHALAQAQQARLEALERELAALRSDTAALQLELAVREDAPVA